MNVNNHGNQVLLDTLPLNVLIRDIPRLGLLFNYSCTSAKKINT